MLWAWFVGMAMVVGVVLEGLHGCLKMVVWVYKMKFQWILDTAVCRLVVTWIDGSGGVAVSRGVAFRR